MKKKGLLGILAVLMVFALALTGCGQQGEQNAGATGSEGQNSTITDNGNANNGEATAGPEETPDVGEVDNRNPEMRDGKYVYEVDGTEILCKTNIWDYIDGDVMFEDLGYERDDSIEVASRSPGFFRYTEEGRLDAFVGAPMDKNSDDFLELRYLNELIIAGQGEFVSVIVRCEQENFATDKADGPRTPIDIVIMTAYLLEQCQDDVSRWYINDIFPDAGTGILRIYQ